VIYFGGVFKGQPPVPVNLQRSSNPLVPKNEINPQSPLVPTFLSTIAQKLRIEPGHQVQMGSSDGPETGLALSDETSDMTLHAQELNLDDLNKMDFLLSDNSEATASLGPIQPETSALQDSFDNGIDLDDILPSESFSTHASPATSLVDGVVYRKPPISIFETKSIPSDLPKHEATEIQTSPKVSSIPQPDRTKDDIPSRFSDVENSPPMRAAGFVGDEIPTIDPLDSDGEWGPIPTYADLVTKFALRQSGNAGEGEDGSNQFEVAEDKKKKKKRKKKSKGVFSTLSPRS
jgi:hypothetical protein